MEEHLVLYVDRLMLLGENGTMPAAEGPSLSGVAERHDMPVPVNCYSSIDVENSAANEGDQLLQMAECRICQEEGLLKDFEIPCACSGSLKVQHLSLIYFLVNFRNFLQTNRKRKKNNIILVSLNKLY